MEEGTRVLTLPRGDGELQVIARRDGETHAPFLEMRVWTADPAKGRRGRVSLRPHEVGDVVGALVAWLYGCFNRSARHGRPSRAQREAMSRANGRAGGEV
jgi:hypothetical protein